VILAQLVALYDRLANAGYVEVQGFERRPIAFLLVLQSDGTLLDVIDTRTTETAGRRGRVFSVPQAMKRTVGIAANILWDNVEYVLGTSRDPKASDAERQKVAARHAAFCTVVTKLADKIPDTAGIGAIRRFLEAHDPLAFSSSPHAAKIEDPTANLSFVLVDEPMRLICELPAVRQALASNEIAGESMRCLVSGKMEPVARLHPPLKGVVGGQASGVSLIAFNLPAFESYGLTQGANAPVGAAAAFAYGTALNWLLAERRHRLRLGQLTVVAWAGTDTPAETFLADVFGEPPRDETEVDRTARVARVHELLAAPRTGISPDALETEFFVLGLAPNAARAAVALWEQGRLADMVDRVRGWFADLQLAGRPSFMPDTFSLPALLRALAPLGEVDRLPPRIAASLLSAALTGHRLPQELLGGALARLRLSRGAAAYSLTALLRVLLRRNHAMESTVSLDPSATDPAYLWGRLFAVFEKAQEEAQPGIDATVRDRFWASAGATPQLVFPVLSRLNGHHLRKLDPPARRRLERLIGEIMGDVRDFPARLSLAEQGRFALGYWHQRTSLFTRREPTATPAENAA